MINWASRHAKKLSSSQSKPGLKSLEFPNGYGSYASGRLTYAKRYRSARIGSRGGMSGFYLCSSPYYSSNYRYDCYGRSYPPLNGFGWLGWRQPMY
jgi:hypothetical protein